MFATCDCNGPISVALTSHTLEDARIEIAVAIATGISRDWIDDSIDDAGLKAGATEADVVGELVDRGYDYVHGPRGWKIWFVPEPDYA